MESIEISDSSIDKFRCASRELRWIRGHDRTSLEPSIDSGSPNGNWILGIFQEQGGGAYDPQRFRFGRKQRENSF